VFPPLFLTPHCAPLFHIFHRVSTPLCQFQSLLRFELAGPSSFYCVPLFRFSRCLLIFFCPAIFLLFVMSPPLPASLLPGLYFNFLQCCFFFFFLFPSFLWAFFHCFPTALFFPIGPPPGDDPVCLPVVFV